MRLTEVEIYQKVANKQLTKAEALLLLQRIQGKKAVSGNPVVSNPAARADVSGGDTIQATVFGIVGRILHLSENEIGSETSFKDLGIDSISGVEIIRDIN